MDANGGATLYQVVSPSYQLPFELIRTPVVRAGRRAVNQQVDVAPGAELVSARW